MGNSSSNSKRKNLEDQIIVSASKVKTNMRQSSGLGIIKHFAIKVVTDEKEEYVIHHTGITGDVLTQLPHVLNRKGYEEESFTVRNRLTIREAEFAGGKGRGYFENGTCIGVAEKIKNRLEG